MRQFTNRANHLMLKYCHSIHTVIEGSSATQSLMAGGLRAMSFVGGLRNRVFIEKDLDEALNHIEQQGCRFRRSYVLRKAREMNLIT